MKNEFKKTLCLLTVFLLTLCVIPGGVFAENTRPDQQTTTVPDVAIEGQTTLENPAAVDTSSVEKKVNLPQLDSQPTVIPQTSGTDAVQGQMTSGNFYYADVDGGVSITGYFGSDAKVIIPDTLDGKKVVEIGSNAFYRCKTLTDLTIPDKITTIGSGAFVYCDKLVNLTLGNSLTTLETRAFAYCNSLKEVSLPKSLTTINSWYVFVGCPALSKVVIPDTTTTISNNIFDKSPLTTIYGSKGSYAQTFAAKYNIPFVENQPSTDVSILYRTHVQNYGWQGFKQNGDMSGTSNEGLRLEGIEIKLDQQQYNLSVDYQTHVQNYGWQDWKKNGNMSGTSNEGLRLEAIRIKLSGADADKFDIYYRVHAQNVGWMGWAKNGADAGTAGYGYRLEGIEIKVLTKGSPAPGSIQNPFLEKK